MTTLGKIVFDPKNGCIVYLENDGVSDLINASIETPRHSGGRLHRSSESGYKDVRKMAYIEGLDPIPMGNANRMWSFIFEEAEYGIF